MNAITNITDIITRNVAAWRLARAEREFKREFNRQLEIKLRSIIEQRENQIRQRAAVRQGRLVSVAAMWPA